MKIALREVLDVTLFTEQGNRIANFDTLKKSNITIALYNTIMILSDALIDLDLLKLIGEEEKQALTDFDQMLNYQKFTTIALGQQRSINIKAFGKGKYRDYRTGEDHDIYFEIPKATIETDFQFMADGFEIHPNDLVIYLHPYDDQGNCMKLHIAH